LRKKQKELEAKIAAVDEEIKQAKEQYFT